jgi:hypothetical protein
MRKLLSLTLSAALVAGTIQQASAETVAVLKDASDQVALQSGKGFFAVSAGTPLSYGDRIVTGPEGHAVVSFSAGKCAGDHQIPPKTLATVSEKTCLDNVAGATAGFKDDYFDWTTVALLGGAVAIGGGVLAYELTQPKKHYVSP